MLQRSCTKRLARVLRRWICCFAAAKLHKTAGTCAAPLDLLFCCSEAAQNGWHACCLTGF
ncbi:MAG: hypothetical protein IJI14_10580 [Anaerolineaceae bacterium]|nr:hypothetical protein [Anaerolineaceae bacterium]